MTRHLGGSRGRVLTPLSIVGGACLFLAAAAAPATRPAPPASRPTNTNTKRAGAPVAVQVPAIPAFIRAA